VARARPCAPPARCALPAAEPACGGCCGPHPGPSLPTPKELVEAEVTVIAGRIPDLGWQLWHGPAYAYPATLLPAMEAVQAAKDPAVGGLRASDELDQALRHAFFVDSQCISIHPVILEIAEHCETVDHRALGAWVVNGFLGSRARLVEVRGPRVLIRRRVGG